MACNFAGESGVGAVSLHFNRSEVEMISCTWCVLIVADEAVQNLCISFSVFGWHTTKHLNMYKGYYKEISFKNSTGFV